MDLATCFKKMELVGVNPIFRETYILGDVKIEEKGYFITDSCIGCGVCKKNCPQR